MILYMHLIDSKPAEFTEWQDGSCVIHPRISDRGNPGIKKFALSYQQVKTERQKVIDYRTKSKYPHWYNYSYIRLVIPK